MVSVTLPDPLVIEILRGVGISPTTFPPAVKVPMEEVSCTFPREVEEIVKVMDFVVGAPRPMVNEDGSAVTPMVAAGLIKRLNILCTACFPLGQASSAMIVNEKVPPLKGVPDIRPEVFMLNPGGRAPEI